MTSTFLRALTGSLSKPAGENPTVAVVEAAYHHHGINARYINCEVDAQDLGEAVRGAWAMGWVGFNCSMPHKVAVLQHLIGVAESARVIGAVNCVTRAADGFVGENTDGQGFLASLRRVVEPAGKNAVIYGAGGAARACAVEMALAGVRRVTVVNRDAGRAAALVQVLNEQTPAQAAVHVWDRTHRVPDGTDIVLNATPVGFAPDAEAMVDLDVNSLQPGMVVADVIVNPARTRLLRAASERGCLTFGGRGMLINQAVLGVKLWTGIDVDPQVMLDALSSILDTDRPTA
jgi:shikimate dehydrogenase